VPLIYEPPPKQGALRQGEIVADVWEHRPLVPAASLGEGETAEVRPLVHSLAIVMTADCDLENDYAERFSSGRPTGPQQLLERDYEEPVLVPYVLMCDLQREDQIKGQVAGSEIMRRVRSNQDERYHKLAEAPYRNGAWLGSTPDLYTDFKKTFALPTEQVCQAVASNGIRRIALVPHTYIHDLMHRFYGYLSRGGVPG